MGKVLAGRYEIVRRLGSGGMGEVFIVRHKELNELRAMKLMLPQVGRDERLRQKFQQEARIGSRIKSEHIVRVLDVGNLRDGLGDHLDVGGGQHVAGDRRGARPADEAPGLNGKFTGRHRWKGYSRTPERGLWSVKVVTKPLPHDRGQERGGIADRGVDGAGVVGVVHVQLHRLVIDLQLRVQHQG